MAEVQAKLKVDGFTEREVIRVDYSFERQTDVEGQTSGIPRGGKITIRAKVLNQKNSDFINWMVSRNLPKHGELIINNSDDNPRRTIEFEDAFCVRYEDCWEDNGMHWEEIILSCREIKFNKEVTYTNKWA